MRLSDPPANREAQANATALSRPRFVDAVKAIEYAGQMFSGDTRPLVGDDYLCLSVRLAPRDVNRAA